MRIVLFAVLAMPVFAADSAPTIAVTGGQIRGGALEKGGLVFKGIPFAQAPVGDLRWREPGAVKAWSGVREATSFAAPCAQNAGGNMQANSSEDCLFLNVWTPEWPARARKPVMVWFHGGGNYAGTASGNNFDGESLARHGVVLVTANYRLTVFGFLAHPELTKESPHHASGNYGLMDQIAALKWVRDNIAKFGGDPANVTIFGQSAGAVDVNVLMTSPQAKGLFHKVIAESGTVTRAPDDATMRMTGLGALMAPRSGDTYSDALTLAEAEKAGEAAFPGSLKQLRTMSAADLLKVTVAPRMSIGPANGIIVDGWIVPKPPAEAFARGEQQRVPLLIGNNSRERTPQVTREELSKAVNAMYGPFASRAFALYTSSAPDPLYGNSGAQWVVDTMYRCPVVVQLNWHAAAGGTGYEYQFDRAAPGREAVGATHGAEVSYVFGNLFNNGGTNYAETDRQISAAMQRYWTNFAKSGDPNGGDLPKWPKYDATARGYIEFTDGGPVAREGLRRAYCDLYVENAKRLMPHDVPR
jgi:para-nitrobenzyl esterase